MNQSQTIAALKGLVPQIKQAGSAEPVLVKYAEENKLSPAQLEKMAQVWNIIRTNNFLDKSAGRRGDTFEIVDVPALVNGYCESHPAKINKPLPADGMNWMDIPDEVGSFKSASTFRGPDLMKTEIDCRENQLEKTASSLVQQDNSAVTRYEKKVQITAGEKQALHRNIETLRDIGSPACWRLQGNLKKFASVLKKLGAEGSREIEMDMTGCLAGYADVDAVCELGRLMAFPGEKIEAWQDKSASTVTLVRDRHGVKDLVSEILNDASFIDGTLLTAQEIKAAANPQIDWQARFTEQKKHIRDLLKQKRDLEKQKGSLEKEKEQTPYDAFNKKLDSMEFKDAPEESSNIPGKEEIPAVAQGVRDSVGGYTQSVEKTHGMMQSILGNMMAPQHTVQKAKDDAAYEVKDTTNLQRLMLSDPILSQANPETVASVYNSIRETNPALAHDMGALRFALREAVQFDGMPMHTLKDVGSMWQEKTRSKLNQKQTEPSGSKPIASASKD